MISHLVRRVAAAIPVLLMVAVFVFSLLYLTPGDPAAIIAGDQASPEDIERIRVSLNLDQPYLIRMGEWLWRVAHGVLGVSIFTGQPIFEQMTQRIGPTFCLMALAMTLSVLIALPLGVLAAWKHNTWIDRVIMMMAVFGFSIPTFVVGYILAYVLGVQLRWLPVQGYTPLAEGIGPWLRSLMLPALALSSGFVGLLSRMTRATMLEVLSQDYVRTAKAKGMGRRVVLFRHALKNAAVPITTIVGLGVAGLIGGAVVTESVFALPGLGRMTVDAIMRRDYPVIQAMILLFSLLYVLVNMIVDVLYTVFDPRVRY